MQDLSEDFRLSEGCPNCGSHRVRVSQVRNPDDKVYCASCKSFICLYGEARDRLGKADVSEAEALIETAVNKKSP